MKKTIATFTVLASLLLSPSAIGAFGDNYDIADVNSPGNQAVPAFPGVKAYWAGTCDIGAAPGFGQPIPGGVGSRLAKIAIDTPKTFGPTTEKEIFLNGFGAFVKGTKLWTPAIDAPLNPAHCIDYGVPNDTNQLAGVFVNNNKTPPTAESWELTPNSPAGWWTRPFAEGGAEEPPFEPSWRFAAETAAAGHPDGTASFAFKRNGPAADGALGADGNTDNIDVALPPGFAGNPKALPKCTGEQFAVRPTQCPPASQVGIATISLSAPPGRGPTTGQYPVYNLEPRVGRVAELGIPDVSKLTSVRIVAKVRTAGDFGVSGWVTQISAVLPLFQQSLTLWGVPWASEHDAWRAKEGFTIGSIPFTGLAPADQAKYDPSWGEVRPFFSNLTGQVDRSDPCDGTGEEANTRLITDNYARPGSFDANGEPDLSDPDWVVVDSPAPALSGCEQVGFDPGITLAPTKQGGAANQEVDSPAGLDVELSIPQNNDLPFAKPPNGAPQVDVDDYLADAAAFWRSIQGLATSHLRDTTVTLPEGMTLNPAAASGQGVCTQAQMGVTETSSPVPPAVRFNNQPVGCPDSSKVAEVVVETPLLDPADWPTGSVYLAEQGDNPFDSDFAIYIAVRASERGLLAKLAGEVTPDPATGRLSTTFSDNPALPFETFRLRFKAGPQAPLATPTTCGTHTSVNSLAPYSDPDSPVVVDDQFQLTGSPAGGCPVTKEQRPLNVGFSAGSTEIVAGAHSPFTVRLTRPDGNQELSRVEVTTPEGLTGTLKGIPACSDAGIARATGRTATGEGALEQADPSCPAASQVGTTTVGAGAGAAPFFVKGKVYLAGPYKGAPISMAFVVPAVAGPFDLGVQVVRAALNINPRTGQITTLSDEIPQILRGIPLRIRDVRVDLDRPGFVLNPTDCTEQQITGRVFGASGATSSVNTRFQVAECARLGFKPKLRLQLKGSTRRGGYPALKATLTAREGDANIARASVALPHSEFLAQEHIRTICTRVQFAADQCPAGSVYGRATAITPLLDQPLSGPVYLRSSDNPLPDLVAALRGPDNQPIEVELAGRTDSKNEGIRNTFDVLPDAPVSKFTLEMQGGRKGLLLNSTNVCKGKHKATVRLNAQNGRAHNFLAPLSAKCGKAKKAKKGANKHRRILARWLGGAF